MTESERPLKRVRKNPCSSCPFRKDCPSGLWDESEYDKLRFYDGDMGQQAEAGGHATFHCHSEPEELCAGWIATFGPWELLALRLQGQHIDPSVFDYTTRVEVFESGQAAYEHGMKDYEHPSPKVMDAIARIKRKRPEVG